MHTHPPADHSSAPSEGTPESPSPPSTLTITVDVELSPDAAEKIAAIAALVDRLNLAIEKLAELTVGDDA